MYDSTDGGMMGDPFGDIEIKNGVLHINQSGGSSWKWGFTDKYRYQKGEFYLIGYSSVAGRPCDYFEFVDFNLMTGKLTLKKEYESCENDGDQEIYKTEKETLIKKGLQITLQNRQEKEIKFTTPKYGNEIFIGTGKE